MALSLSLLTNKPFSPIVNRSFGILPKSIITKATSSSPMTMPKDSRWDFSSKISPKRLVLSSLSFSGGTKSLKRKKISKFKKQRSFSINWTTDWFYLTPLGSNLQLLIFCFTLILKFWEDLSITQDSESTKSMKKFINTLLRFKKDSQSMDSYNLKKPM